MKKLSRLPRPLVVVNVKVPEFLTDIIDRNLESGKTLEARGFVGRAHFVEKAVLDKLLELNLISQQDADELVSRRTNRAIKRKKKIKNS